MDKIVPMIKQMAQMNAGAWRMLGKAYMNGSADYKIEIIMIEPGDAFEQRNFRKLKHT